MSKGLLHGYFADLLGRAATAGEQLGLAFAVLRDPEVRRDTDVEVSRRNHRAIAGRAMAEASGLWAVPAGHAAVNVAARIVRIHSNAGGPDEKLGWIGLLVPFDSARIANLSSNVETVTYIRGAAHQLLTIGISLVSYRRGSGDRLGAEGLWQVLSRS